MSADVLRPTCFSLTLLGGCALTGLAGPVGGRVAQRRRLAVLAVVAASGRDGVSRDRLLALLWPESTTESARHRLADTLSVLRATLGETALRGVGDRVALDVGVVDCDVRRFADAVRRSDPAAAAAAYGGPFLDGFHVPDAPDFERWADGERARLAREAAGALEQLADEHEGGGDHRAAAEWWRRLAALDPYNGRVAMRLMRALEAAGDRAAAIRQAGLHATLLREEVGTEPDPEVLALEGRLRRAPAAHPGPVASPSRLGAHPPSTAPSPANGVHATDGENILASLVAGNGHGTTPTAEVGPAQGTPSGPLPAAPAAAASAPAVPRGAPLARVARPALAAGIALLAGGAWLLNWQGGANRDVDRGLVAVLPFRTSGAPSVGYLREGMLDLLAAKLTGEGGLRALDPATLLAAWRPAVRDERQDLPRADAITLARRLRAGGVIQGTIVATPGQLVLSAVLLEVPGGGERGRVEVAGPPDSLPALVDRLTARLLVTQASRSGVPLEAAATTSLAALRNYLDGQAAVRRGRFDDAVRHFGAALDADSTFALAAIGEMEVSIFHGFQTPPPRLGRLGWTYRDRLGERDRAYLVALVGGRRYPLPTPLADRLLDWQAAVEAAPDRAGGWSRLGDLYWHYGATIGIDSFADLAASAFERAIALDSTYVPAFVHLIDIAALRRDTVAARRWVDAYAATDTAPHKRAGYRWVVATAIGDSTTVRALRAAMPELRLPDLDRIALWTLQSALGAHDAERAVELMWARVAAAPATEPARHVSSRRGEVLFGLGRPAAARLALLATAMDSALDRRLIVLMSIVSGADTAAAAVAARAMAASAIAAPAADKPGRTGQHMDACHVELWRLSRGDTRATEATISRLRAADTTTIAPGAVPAAQQCALLLEAQLAVAHDSPTARGVIERLDASMATHRYNWVDLVANLFLARAWEARGDHARALRAVRRREWNAVFTAAPQFREEARLAARLGDREGAIRAYRAYLALYHDPEPELRAEVARVRAELARRIGQPVSGDR